MRVRGERDHGINAARLRHGSCTNTSQTDAGDDSRAKLSPHMILYFDTESGRYQPGDSILTFGCSKDDVNYCC